MTRRTTVLALSIAVLLASLGGGTALLVESIGAGDEKTAPEPPPERSLPPDERSAVERTAVAGYWATQEALREKFIAERRDIRDLPVVEIETQDVGSPSLRDTILRSVAVAQGVVVAQRIEGGTIVSEFEVAAWLAGDGGKTIEIVSPEGRS
jgi:hypothetical protein